MPKRDKMKYFCAIISCLFILANIHAQSLTPEIVTTAGDNFSTTDVSMSWTLGEVMVETYDTTATVILSQGFQQGTLSGTAIDDLYTTFGLIKVFPNPTTQMLRIQREHGQELHIRLSDIRGRELMRRSYRELYSELDLSHLAEGVYLLHLSNGDKIGKTIRIQKE